MEAVIQIINAIKWPSVVILALIIFRKPVSELISYITSIKWGNFEATFGRKIKQLEKDANNLPYPIDVKVGKVSAFDTSDRYVQLAKIDPRSAFLDAWRDLELIIFDKARELNIRAKHSIRKIVNNLYDKGVIEPIEKDLFEKLRILRNEALYARLFDISFIDAVTYARTAKKLAESIKTKNNK